MAYFVLILNLAFFLASLLTAFFWIWNLMESVVFGVPFHFQTMWRHEFRLGAFLGELLRTAALVIFGYGAVFVWDATGAAKILEPLISHYAVEHGLRFGVILFMVAAASSRRVREDIWFGAQRRCSPRVNRYA